MSSIHMATLEYIHVQGGAVLDRGMSVVATNNDLLAPIV